MADALARFSAPTRAWFSGAFVAPTLAQEQGWDAIAEGKHVLLSAPTGSGKTLTGFLWALDRLATDPVPTDDKMRCRVLYVSPLKALTYDVERNLQSPLRGIAIESERAGLPLPDIRVGARTGDTPADERRALVKHPPDVLVTTPESLYLLLTSQAKSSLAGVDTVIVDEIHAVAGTKRGAHLALSLERLEALVREARGPDATFQRIGLSATQRPLEEVGRFLGGLRDGRFRPVTIVEAKMPKVFDLGIEVIPHHFVKQIRETEAVIYNVHSAHQERTLRADTIVMVTARQSENALSQAVLARDLPVETIGDANAPRGTYEAVFEGHRAGRKV